MRVLITGGSGYLGQHLLAYLQSQPTNPHELFYTYATTPVSSFGAPGTGLHMDFTNPASVHAAVAAARPDVVVHTAAQVRGEVLS
jgi:dTDP-4-dehydrorhamnose reductase